MPTLALLIAATLPQPSPAVREYVDSIEQNHFHDQCGHLVFTQVIFWSRYAGRLKQVVDWRLNKEGAISVERDWRYGGYVARWFDRDKFREVRCRAVDEIYSQSDRELDERELLPVESRRKLRSR